MTETTKTIYIANDGKEFLTSEEALAHEAKLEARAINRTFWEILYIKDVMFPNETISLYVEVRMEDKSLAREFLEDYCHEMYGKRIGYKESNIPVVNWSISKLDPKDFGSVGELSAISFPLELVGEFQPRLTIVA